MDQRREGDDAEPFGDHGFVETLRLQDESGTGDADDPTDTAVVARLAADAGETHERPSQSRSSSESASTVQGELCEAKQLRLKNRAKHSGDH
jgi:hypothetical protein